jgi:hypothetical protein
MVLARPAVAESAADIEAWYKSYAPLWAKSDVDLDAVETYYAKPGYVVGLDGAVLTPSLEAHKSAFVTFIAGLKQKFSAAAISSTVACTPASSSIRHRDARALTMLLSTLLSARDRVTAMLATPFGKITSFGPPRLANAMGTRTVMVRASRLQS